MPQRSLSIGLLVAATLAGATLPLRSAHAADLDFSFGDAPPPVAETKVEFGTGWYVRGDIGATHGFGVHPGDEPYDTSLYTAYPGSAAVAAVAAKPATTTSVTNPDGTVTTTTTAAVAAVPGSAAVPAGQFPRGVFDGPGQTAPGLSGGSTSGLNYTASLGGGYQFNRWFRVDAIFDFHQPVKSSLQGQGHPCITGTAGIGTQPYQYEVPYTTTCTPTLLATLKSYDTLINGYIDLGKWYAVTPYVGAGIGLSFGHAQASSKYVQGNGAPYQISYIDAVNGATYSQNFDRSQSSQYYNLAFAFMGGVAINVYDHTVLDVGYRYLHLGDVLGSNLNIQEVRAGLRYMIDN